MSNNAFRPIRDGSAVAIAGAAKDAKAAFICWKCGSKTHSCRFCPNAANIEGYPCRPANTVSMLGQTPTVEELQAPLDASLIWRDLSVFNTFAWAAFAFLMQLPGVEGDGLNLKINASVFGQPARVEFNGDILYVFPGIYDSSPIIRYGIENKVTVAILEPLKFLNAAASKINSVAVSYKRWDSQIAIGIHIPAKAAMPHDFCYYVEVDEAVVF